jgi:wobble nucleotide-excising tRNase
LDSAQVSTELKSGYDAAKYVMSAELSRCEGHLAEVLRALTEKRQTPTQVPDTTECTLRARGSAAQVGKLVATVNDILRNHNQAVDGFLDHQGKAHLAVRRHFVATLSEEFTSLVTEQTAAQKEDDQAAADLAAMKQAITQLRSEIREHGPAAETINALVAAYLGHGELTICAIADGYEIHRHGRPVEGAPSEGEKTAIAICYFLSTLESEGRSIKDLIVVVDDPVSSLDTKALNFACALVRARLTDCAQLFVLTHNLHCMNEFKKAWKNKERSEDGKEPSATFLFMDVTVPGGQTARSTRIKPLSRLLRDYDSEYHFLVDQVLKFETTSDPEYEYAYMMPNVLRRVLDVFLAFRCPGTHGLASKIQQLCKENPTLDANRLTALERLTQMESHSDSLDDLITFSSMTVEEARAANSALLEMMQTVDPAHLRQLRRLCA